MHRLTLHLPLSGNDPSCREVAFRTLPDRLLITLSEVSDFIGMVGNEVLRGLVEAFVQGIGRNRISLPVFPLVMPGSDEMFTETRRSDHVTFRAMANRL